MFEGDFREIFELEFFAFSMYLFSVLLYCNYYYNKTHLNKTLQDETSVKKRKLRVIVFLSLVNCIIHSIQDGYRITSREFSQPIRGLVISQWSPGQSESRWLPSPGCWRWKFLWWRHSLTFSGSRHGYLGPGDLESPERTQASKVKAEKVYSRSDLLRV